MGGGAGKEDPYLLSVPTPTPPRSLPAPSLALSFQRTLGTQRASTRARGAFYINHTVWARGGRGATRAGPHKAAYRL
jgi:hypothetical protein